jgi:hypothetical protein
MSAAHVSGPQTPSTRKPRLRWNSHSAPTVEVSYTPSIGTAIPAAPSRCWTSRTARHDLRSRMFGQLFTGGETRARQEPMNSANSSRSWAFPWLPPGAS